MVSIKDLKNAAQSASDWLNQQDTGGYVKGPPLTQTASSHAITIKTQRGIKIGRIQSWSPNMARTVDSNFEVNAAATGEPVERVPQIQGTNSISVDRYELYTFHMGEAFGVAVSGGTDLVSLTQQTNPFHVREVWRDPYGNIRAYIYVNCYFSNIGITISATDDRIIKAKATLEFTRRLRLN
jgi:hypothetical protein